MASSDDRESFWRDRYFPPTIIVVVQIILNQGALCQQYLVSVHKLTVSKKVVIPAKAGIQSFRDLLDAPISGTGQAPQVRHDGKSAFINRLYLNQSACSLQQQFHKPRRLSSLSNLLDNGGAAACTDAIGACFDHFQRIFKAPNTPCSLHPKFLPDGFSH